MIYIKLTPQLKDSSAQNSRKFITSDETWAFTEQPKELEDRQQIPPHDLFNLFTAEIIQANRVFVK